MMRNTTGFIGGGSGILAWEQANHVLGSITIDTTNIATATVSAFSGITTTAVIEAAFFAIFGTILALITRKIFIWVDNKLFKKK